jgi:molybdopterin-guanine dinucleotide biosynthesis protein A
MRSAAILAGGQATRFGGRDKSALVVDGRSILERQVAELSAVVDEIMIVGGTTQVAPGVPGSADFDAPASARQTGAGTPRFVADVVPGCGPLGGVHAALTAMRGDCVFVAACDMPHIAAALVDFLLSLAAEAPIVVPHTDRGYHPLCAVYTRACLEPIAVRLTQRRLAVRELLRDVPARIVTAEEMTRFGAPSRLLANVNTPAEYAHLEALQSHKL